MDDLIGKQIGGYRIAARIGKGGMGAVYLAVHPTLGKRVAIKFITGEVDAEARRRFLDEARAAAALDDPHVVAVHDLAELPDGRAYLVMDYLEGESLAAMLRRRHHLPPGEAVALAAQALQGLAAAHARGIVHRDVKPANLMVARAGAARIVKVLDFGVAKLYGLPRSAATRSGVIMGTPQYMAPEQASGRPDSVDARTDLYAVGVVLHEMLAGELPFAAADWGALLVMHQSAEPPPLDAPPALAAVVRRALAKSPADRFAGAKEMRLALLEALGGAEAVPALPEPEVLEVALPEPAAVAATSPAAGQRVTVPPTRRHEGRRRWPLAVVVAAVMTAAAVGVWRAARTTDRPATGAVPAPAPVPDSASAPAAVSVPVAASAAAERCDVLFTDELGQTQTFGGPRTLMPEAGKASVMITGNQVWFEVQCTCKLGGGWISLAIILDPRKYTLGKHTLRKEDNVFVMLSSGSAPGFSVGRYVLSAGTLDIAAFGHGGGSPIDGALDADFAPAERGGRAIHARMRFNLLQ